MIPSDGDGMIIDACLYALYAVSSASDAVFKQVSISRVSTRPRASAMA